MVMMMMMMMMNRAKLISDVNCQVFWTIVYIEMVRMTKYCNLKFWTFMSAGCFTHYVYCCSLDLLSSFFFSPPNLRARWADRNQTLPHVRWWPRFIKVGQKFGWPFQSKCGGPKTLKFRSDFTRLRDLITNFSATRYRQSENGVGNYGHSRTGKLNSVYFGP